jgi:NTE family protein
LLESYFNERVFGGKTYGDLIEADQLKDGRRPYVVLNATDMDTGSAFSFTQDQFDLICGDLSGLKIADAVTASAAFPVALTALTLKNRSPCPAQQKAAEAQNSWVMIDGFPRPIWVRNDLSEDASNGLRAPAADNLPRLRRGSAAVTYLNETSDPSKPRPKDYIQLLDGGLADNLGLTRPIEMLTSNQAMPSFRNRINTCEIKRVLLLVVNARSEPPNSFGKSAAPPGLFETIWTTAGTPIDAASSHLLDSLENILNDPEAVLPPGCSGKRIGASGVLVDFSLLADPDCRERFHAIATSWTLSGPEVDALIAMGEAMVLQSKALQSLVTDLHGTIPPPSPTVPEVCRTLRASSS